MTRNYYTVLQISPNAEQEVIEAAYKRLARKYDPEVYSGADGADRLRELNEAYEVLRDAGKRAEYHSSLSHARAHAAPPRSKQGRPTPSVQPALAKGARRPRAKSPSRPGRPRRTIGQFRNLGFVAALVVAVVAAIALIGVANLLQGDDDSDNTPIDIPDHTAPADGMTLGNADAPVTVYEYSDFQCPFCARTAAEVVPRLDTDYLATGKAKLIFKNLAFIGQESKWAAEAAACAGDQDKFWEYHNKLFEEQNGENKGTFEADNLKRFAGEIGLNQGEFNTCFDAGKYTGQIADEISEAENRGVNATPTFFVGQTAVEASYDAISEAIDAALATPAPATATPEATPTAEGTPGG
ncbi:MAG TPA: thioredoxin domain-containing protein [Dehalococcoidia bacterium]|nr:thioredoxin domain-containing protein [Dehalococcoidia bacterium]